jgi:hypothetical protein
MKLKLSEYIALAAVILAVLYSAAGQQNDADAELNGVINRRVLKEDSTVILIDLPVPLTGGID